MTKPAQILITAHPFARDGQEAVDILQRAGLSLRRHGLERRPQPADLAPLLPGVQGLIAGTEPLSAELLALSPQLRVISRLGVGLDSIDMDYCHLKGIDVLTTPDVATTAVAEYTLGLILDLCRGITASHRSIAAGQWQRHFGLGLAGTRLGLLGFGRIGQTVAQMARGLGMRVSAHDPFVSQEVFAVAGVLSLGLVPLLQSSQILSLHLPLLPETKGLVDAKTLALLPAGAFLINTARGAIVDEQALFDALTTGHLAGAALDVFADEPYTGPLADLPNLILTAHQAANTRQARMAMENAAAENIVAYFKQAN